jgi:hypothetical protein
VRRQHLSLEVCTLLLHWSLNVAVWSFGSLSQGLRAAVCVVSSKNHMLRKLYVLYLLVFLPVLSLLGLLYMRYIRSLFCEASARSRPRRPLCPNRQIQPNPAKSTQKYFFLDLLRLKPGSFGKVLSLPTGAHFCDSPCQTQFVWRNSHDLPLRPFSLSRSNSEISAKGPDQKSRQGRQTIAHGF